MRATRTTRRLNLHLTLEESALPLSEIQEALRSLVGYADLDITHEDLVTALRDAEQPYATLVEETEMDTPTENPEPMTEEALDNIGLCLEHGGGIHPVDADRTIRELYAEVLRLRSELESVVDAGDTIVDSVAAAVAMRRIAWEALNGAKP
jgi:hypothetical protein